MYLEEWWIQNSCWLSTYEWYQIRDSYLLSLINDMLEHLDKGKVFLKLDLRSAYKLIRIKEGDEYKTAFTYKWGHYEYLVMHFDLKNASAVFQYFINDVL